MDITIIGLPSSGKTTIFNAVTRGAAEVASYANKPNLGVAKVPDERLVVLEGIYSPKRTVHAEVTYVDLPAAPEGFGESKGISGEYLNYLQRADALLIVARAFEDPAVPHVSDSIDPDRDVETMLYELAFADLEILDRRIARIKEGFKSAKTAERDALNKEQALLLKVKSELEEGAHIRDQELGADDLKTLIGFQLLTSKPIIVAANVGEDDLADLESVEKRLSERFAGPRVRVAALCGKLEMELAQMAPDDEADFRRSLEAGESGLSRMIRLSYEVLDLVTFLTVGEDEVRAWPITRGTPAVSAAGTIHTDLERGFIRGEVVAFDDLERCRSLAEARKQGVLRQEGRGYVVKDGDIMHVLFNV